MPPVISPSFRVPPIRALSMPDKSLASLILKFPLSDTTPMLFSVSLSLSAPPKILSVSPFFLVITASSDVSSPVNFRFTLLFSPTRSSVVAILSISNFSSSLRVRINLLPSKLALVMYLSCKPPISTVLPSCIVKVIVPTPASVYFNLPDSIVLPLSCFKLTISVSSVPAATLVILLPPLSRPVLLNLTSETVGFSTAVKVVPSLV